MIRLALLAATLLLPAAGTARASGFEDVEQAGFSGVAGAQRLLSADLTAESLELAALETGSRIGRRRECGQEDASSCRARCRREEGECMRGCSWSSRLCNLCWEVRLNCESDCRRGTRRRCRGRSAGL